MFDPQPKPLARSLRTPAKPFQNLEARKRRQHDVQHDEVLIL
jgi:hypothetical protein